MNSPTLAASLIAVIALAGATTSSSAQTSSRPLAERVRIGAHVYRADARVVSTWRGFDATGKRTTGADAIYTMESMCVFNGQHPPTLERIGYGWTFNVASLTTTNDTATLQLSWQRARDRGAPVSGPAGTVTLTLKPGQSVPLDYIVASTTPTAWGPCTAVGMLLDVSVDR